MIELVKFVFVGALTGLNPGGSQPWPLMTLAQNTSPATLTHRVAAGDTWQGCARGSASTCVPGFVSGYTVQSICLGTPGAYQLTARLGTMPLAPGSPRIDGALWLDGPEPLFVMAFSAEAGVWSTQGATHVFCVASPACIRFLYDLDGSAQINPDIRATYFTLHRLSE